MLHSPSIMSVFDLEANKYGSMEEYALFLSVALKNRGWKNVLVYVRSVSPEIRKALTDAGAIVEVIPTGGQPGCYRELMRVLWKHRADIVHYHFLEHFSLLPILGWLPRPRLQLFTDHYRQPQPIGWLTKGECLLWDRLIFRALGIQILAISEHVKKTLVGCYGMKPHRIRVVLNGINVERFKPTNSALADEVRDELRVARDTALIICASNLRPEKGISDLLAAAQVVAAQKKNTLFVLIGEGPESSHLRQEAVERGIQQHVWFAGARSDVHRFMAAGNVIAVPSVWQEPAGLVAIEAMAVGRPVVATRVGGIPEYVQDGVTGILVEPRAPSHFAGALLCLLRDPGQAEAMGRAGRTRVEAHFSMQRWVQDTEQVYEAALHYGEEL